ncbi:hypothetical protein LSM04_001810 [Trypanosoma melophagium]|uniref:uncharacterized protein n=1 Tax=Trypanosoma melophagium TaxID=715481 RepID=UPI00351A28D4|nr:hypothetical protein LSM04_001810 [Trypanosoma melophagium]
MTTNSPKKYDSSSKWLRQAAFVQIDSLLTLKRATKTTNRSMLQDATNMVLQAKLGILGNVSRDKSSDNTTDFIANNSTTPLAVNSQTVQTEEENEEDLHPPLSLFLPHARFLQSRYYTSLLRNPSARRSCTEPQLEATVFTETGLGEIRVLCAVPVQEGFERPKSRIFAVARDWTVAYCFLLSRNP